jgi:predicted HTH domain antitoxin
MLSNRIIREVQRAAAIRWYQQGEISQEKAAELAGLNRRDFLMELARKEVDVFDVKLDELREELQFR